MKSLFHNRAVHGGLNIIALYGVFWFDAYSWQHTLGFLCGAFVCYYYWIYKPFWKK